MIYVNMAGYEYIRVNSNWFYKHDRFHIVTALHTKCSTLYTCFCCILKAQIKGTWRKLWNSIHETKDWINMCEAIKCQILPGNCNFATNSIEPNIANIHFIDLRFQQFYSNIFVFKFHIEFILCEIINLNYTLWHSLTSHTTQYAQAQNEAAFEWGKMYWCICTRLDDNSFVWCIGFKPNTKIYRKIHLRNGNDTMRYNLNHVRQQVVHFCNHHRLARRRLA